MLRQERRKLIEHLYNSDFGIYEAFILFTDKYIYFSRDHNYIYRCKITEFLDSGKLEEVEERRVYKIAKRFIDKYRYLLQL